MTELVIVVIVTLFISSMCSLFEATLFSTRTGALEATKAAGINVSLAEKFLEMKRNIAEPISSILILNTISHTAGATLAGMYAASALGAGYVPIFSVVFTVFILFISEIAPKTIGAVYWKNLWPFLVWPIRAMKYALYPAIVVTQAFSRLFHGAPSTPSVTEDEILAIVRLGAKAGEITLDESKLVHNIISLENEPVRKIMTPRTVIVSLDANMTIKEAREAIDGKGLTRFPIYENDRENIIGYVLSHDLLSMKRVGDENASIKTLAKQISFVPQTMDSLTLLTNCLSRRIHIFIVIDEFGGVAGLVTLEDVLEAILGYEIVDETDREVDLQQLAKRRRDLALEKLQEEKRKR